MGTLPIEQDCVTSEQLVGPSQAESSTSVFAIRHFDKVG
jgi:hypothetical protein